MKAMMIALWIIRQILFIDRIRVLVGQLLRCFNLMYCWLMLSAFLLRVFVHCNFALNQELCSHIQILLRWFGNVDRIRNWVCIVATNGSASSRRLVLLTAIKRCTCRSRLVNSSPASWWYATFVIWISSQSQNFTICNIACTSLCSFTLDKRLLLWEAVLDVVLPAD